IPGVGLKFYLQFTTVNYRSGEDAGSCFATVLYPKKRSPPTVNIKCTYTRDWKQIQEEDKRFYQKLTHQSKPIIANDIPDSHGNIEHALLPVWGLAVAGSSYIMWEKSTENLGYFLAQVKSARQQIRNSKSVEFEFIVLLHEIPTQKIIRCHMHLSWSFGHPPKVRYSCTSDNDQPEDGSGMELGSDAGISHEREENF
ncbi:OCX32 protein, partial [Alectura lathami]|nr:OCX32 protein [Alectura lathami]